MKSSGLTDTRIRQAKAADRPYNLYDTGGLYLTVSPTGARWWRLKYRHAGKEKRIGFGAYPEVTLAEARKQRDIARMHLREGRDPGAHKRAEKARAVLAAKHTFGTVAAEWLEKQRPKLAEVTYRKATWELGLAAPLDNLPISEISPQQVLTVLRKIEARGAHDTAHRVKQRISLVYRYAIATSRTEIDPTASLRGALAPVVSKNMAAILDPDAIAGLLRAIDGYQGQPVTHAALKLAPLVFVRPGNLRAMEWGEIDFKAGEWRIPAGKMKVRERHVVPLAKQAVRVLEELQPLTSYGRFVFPSIRTPDRPMSENTVNAALRRLGYDKDTMTGHGFRAMASTRLNEMGWSPDVIERQLGHAERNKVRAAYNRAQYMAERRTMMQAWADYLDELKSGTKVVPIKRSARGAR